MVPPGSIGIVRPFPVLRRRGFVTRPVPFFAFRRFHRFHQGFGSPFCSPVFGIGISTHRFGLFGSGFDCFPRPSFSPFFFPFAPLALSEVVVEEPPAPAYYVKYAYDTTGGTSYTAAPTKIIEVPAEQEMSGASEGVLGTAPHVKPRVTLLQLRDGSMYGLTDYWLENGHLHYVTTYGGANSVPLERIDFDETVRLNAERGVEFVLRPKPATH